MSARRQTRVKIKQMHAMNERHFNNFEMIQRKGETKENQLKEFRKKRRKKI